MTKSELLEGARSLPAAERIDLAMELWDSLRPLVAETAISPALEKELVRRMQADEANLRPPERWTDLRAKLLRGEF